MININKICDYIRSGETKKQRLGLELEHFVCDDKFNVAPYSLMCDFFVFLSSKELGELYYEEGNILGIKCNEYDLTLEPAGQLEISVCPQSEIAEIERIYKDFCNIFECFFNEKGYKLIRKGVHPLVEKSSKSPFEFDLIPKTRYKYMDEYFKSSGKFGAYMMRATASAQISVDFESENDAMRKLSILQKISPFLSLITENRSFVDHIKPFENHLLRTQIWNDLDADRCGYLPNSLNCNYKYKDYAEYIYNKPLICTKDDKKVISLGNKTANEYFKGKELNDVDYIISMFFPNIRLKKFLEIRVADSMELPQFLGYCALIKGLVYSKQSIDKISETFDWICGIDTLYKIEKSLSKQGLSAEINGKSATYYIEQLFAIAESALSEQDKCYLAKLKPLFLLEKEYFSIVSEDENHRQSAIDILDYLEQSTAKYHNRTVRTLYMPKIFTNKEIDLFANFINVLYDIFDKVINEYERNAEYRKLFDFPKVVEDLILRERSYSCNIPISRVDIFYNELNSDFKFCEFNTDGSSAMNEDRELNIAIKLSKAYNLFSKKHNMKSFELFDSWIDELLEMYREYANKYNKNEKPNIAIVDFMEHSTENEFIIFADRMRNRGLNATVCDIRSLEYKNGKLYHENTQIDLIYRRAVTSDIIENLDSVSDFLSATADNSVCVVGDIRTQIVHNKSLFRVLHLPQTQKLLSEFECEYIKNHVPYTVSLEKENLNNNILQSVMNDKDKWIIKPIDSYGSLGVHAGVESDLDTWRKYVEDCFDKSYILQEFCNPYVLKNVRFTRESESAEIVDTCNLTGLFVYNGKFSGIYSRVSLSEIISTQYSEISLPTIIVD